MRIGPRLLLNAVLIASFAVITTILLIGTMSYNYGKNILEEQARDRLTLVRDLKAEHIEKYFEAMKKQAVLFSDNQTIIQAMKEFNAGFSKYAQQVSTKGMDKYKDEVIKRYISEFSRDYANDNGGIPFDAAPYLNVSKPSTFALQYNYIFNNPHGIDKESKLVYVDDGSDYSKTHSVYHDQLLQLKELFSIEDIFLVDAKNGDIVYTVAKGLDFTTSLIDGPYANTALGDAFRRANTTDGTKPVIVSQFEAYSPSNDDQSCFIATAIYDNGVKIGILIFQLDYMFINNLMTSQGRWQEIGLGKTGESYLVDNNLHMITMSRFFHDDPEAYLNLMDKNGLDDETLIRMKAKGNNIGLLKINTLGAEEAVQGKTGFAIYQDYRGVKVLGAYEPINVSGVNWGVVVEIDETEAFAPVQELAKKMIINLFGIMILIIIFATIVGIGLAKQISVPIQKLSAKILTLSATQDLTKRIEYNANDEIGDMAKALNSLLDSFQKTTQETIISTQKVQSTANKLITLADEIDARETNHKYEDNFDAVHQKTEEIKNAGDSLAELSSRLQVLSRQFKVFEAESDKASGW